MRRSSIVLIVLAAAAANELNRKGRLFVTIGRRTFSSAIFSPCAILSSKSSLPKAAPAHRKNEIPVIFIKLEQFYLERG
ncbi:MAG: hypothetical protein WBC70_04485 [Candidatus Aminicenantales bacterium]